jgi:uncharacterized protein YndB with AHSA1/START domain
MSEEKTPNRCELQITRTFNAPRHKVFEAWTKQERFKEWWGPEHFTMEIKKLDLQPGGTLHYSQRTPDGHTFWGRFIYQEIKAPKKLVFINSFSNEEGDAVRAPFSGTWPLEIQNTIQFEEADGKTTLIMQGVPLNATKEELETFAQSQELIQQGFQETLDQLDDFLSQY